MQICEEKQENKVTSLNNGDMVMKLIYYQQILIFLCIKLKLKMFIEASTKIKSHLKSVITQKI